MLKSPDNKKYSKAHTKVVKIQVNEFPLSFLRFVFICKNNNDFSRSKAYMQMMRMN